MPMQIMNQTITLLALNEWNKNTNKLAKSIQKASSGLKINTAGDGASEYAISERMQAQLRGLEQAKANTQSGSSLLRIAEGGVQNIIDAIQTMKELALRSANGIYTDQERAIMQKEWEAHTNTIEEIAAATNFNGQRLLDGTYGQYIEGEVALTKPLDDMGMIANGDVTISVNGIYTIPTGYSGTITVTSHNVELKQQGAGEVAAKIVCAEEHTALWINTLNIKNTDGKSLLTFTGKANSLQLMGNNTMRRSLLSSHCGIDTGTGLTICDGSGDGTLTTDFWGGASAIGSNQKKGYLDIDSGTVTVGGAGQGDNLGSVEALTIYGGTVRTGVGSASEHAGIGTVSGGTLTINGGTVISRGDTGIGGNGNVVINAGTIEAFGSFGAAIGSNLNQADSGGGNITINGGNVLAVEDTIGSSDYGGAGIGSGAGNSCGNITFRGGTVIATASDTGHGAENVGKGSNGGTTGVITYQAGTVNGVDYGPYTEHAPTAPTLTMDGEVLNDPLHFQTSTKANADVRCYIESLHLSALGLTGSDVLTMEHAKAAVDQLDDALTYASGQNTQIGAMIARMDFTARNLTTAHENVTSAESNVRDADMAKTMTEYTKNNILAQAAQWMLAQANQNSGDVLNLLK